ncbi:hypothetical protein STIUS_v1c05730 [Spiroplasma sp. TIUS-1]|uniref:hypothetical protein n=1 Tax=Spiroplasma sp. TIUS-1 TaxID=216963 RepID=UPI00139968EF|nr:hypothetical protein [Spiroplasma sp. TIUS-1]QHX36127.1 hypothetical protein STIUS_v1c05730 [Spiroplasma sp. TIUS-1]
MKKLFKILAATIFLSSTSLTLVSCFPKEVEVYYSANGYKFMTSEETKKQVPLIMNKIASFANPYMKGNITDELYFNIKTWEEKDMILGQPVNERQKEIMLDTFSANLRIYKIISIDSILNPAFFEATWSKVSDNQFSIDITYVGTKVATMSGEFFVSNTNEISEINENTFVQISEMAEGNKKIVTSPGMGAFWGVTFIGDKYTKEEQVQLWEEGGKYQYYDWKPKQTMTWKGEQKIEVDELKQTMTDYLTSRLITSGTIQSNLKIDYEQVDMSTSGFKGSSTEFIPKEGVSPETAEKHYQSINMGNPKNNEYFFYFEEDNDFGATTIIDPNYPYIWYKTRPDHKIKQGGSMFQSHLEYKW